MNGSRHRIRHSGESRNPGGGWRQPHPNTSSDQVSFSYLGVPAPADMSDWYESMSRTPTRDEWFPPRVLVSSCRRPSESPRTRHSRESGNPGVGYGLQMSRKHLHQSTPRFSYLGVPAADMSDWCESMSRTPTRDGWFPPPNSSFRRGRNPGEESAAATNFHTSVCRRQPARAIPMEPCPASTSDRLIATSAEILGLATAKSNPRGRIGRGRGPYQQIEGDESGPSRSPASAPS